MDPALLLTLRFSFALLLAASSLHKLRDLERFRGVLREYGVLPGGAARVAAPVFAAVEAVLAAMLAVGAVLPIAALSAATLLITYAAAIYVNVTRGRTDLDCGCMGPAARVPVSAALVVRNLALAAAAAAMMVPPGARALHWMDVATALVATTALAATWQASERLLALAPRAAKLRAAARERPR